VVTATRCVWPSLVFTGELRVRPHPAFVGGGHNLGFACFLVAPSLQPSFAPWLVLTPLGTGGFCTAKRMAQADTAVSTELLPPKNPTRVRSAARLVRAGARNILISTQKKSETFRSSPAPAGPRRVPATGARARFVRALVELCTPSRCPRGAPHHEGGGGRAPFFLCVRSFGVVSIGPAGRGRLLRERVPTGGRRSGPVGRRGAAGGGGGRGAGACGREGALCLCVFCFGSVGHWQSGD